MTAGHGKEQREVFSKADNRSEVTKHGHLPAGSIHTLPCYQADAQNLLVIHNITML